MYPDKNELCILFQTAHRRSSPYHRMLNWAIAACQLSPLVHVTPVFKNSVIDVRINGLYHGRHHPWFRAFAGDVKVVATVPVVNPLGTVQIPAEGRRGPWPTIRRSIFSRHPNIMVDDCLCWTLLCLEAFGIGVPAVRTIRGLLNWMKTDGQHFKISVETVNGD